MVLAKQIWTLMSKNFRYVILRHLPSLLFIGLVIPIAVTAFLTFARNLFVPPATYGIGDIRDVRTLSDAFAASSGSGREKVVFVDNGFAGGDIERVFDSLESSIRDASGGGMDVVRVDDEDAVTQQCPSSLRGVTTCFNAIVMRSSPDEGSGGIWNYTIRTDGAFEGSPFKIDVDKSTNPPQVYILPMQRAVDTAIANLEDSDGSLLDRTREYTFTSQTTEQRERKVREIYMGAIISFLGVAYIATILWITYHMTGFIATERESGMSQLIDAMMPVRQQWMSQAARIISHHLAFSLMYLPGWVIGSIILKFGVFTNTSAAIVIIYHVLAGMALASMSVLYASFFKRAQLSGIVAILATLLLGILAQSITSPDTTTVAILSVLFTPCGYTYFLTLMARFEKIHEPTNLVDSPPNSPWDIPGIVFWVLVIIQIFVYPLLGALIEGAFYGTITSGRKIHVKASGEEDVLGDNALMLDGFTKIYKPNILSRRFGIGSKPREPVVAVDNLTLNAGKGQIVALLGANGSGKSTTLDAIAGLNKLTSGSISIDGTGGLGIAPQKNVLWDDLSVEEHIRIFDHLKSPSNHASKEEVTELIQAIDLLPKRKALAKTLSGGQRRKLQIGVMLTGGSAVCCVDEVSSGLDPLSRRKIWDILLAERGKRTLIMTTHFLDEADLLADHIAIMSKGSLRAQGSSVELKEKLGGGYRVHFSKPANITTTPDVDGVHEREAFGQVTYIAPSSSLAAEVIKQLEASDMKDYRFSGPTIEDVFLQLAEEIKDEEAFHTTDKGVELREKNRELRDSEDASQDASPDTPQDVSSAEGLKLMDGNRVGYFGQAVILLVKRFIVLKRNWIPYLIAFILPIFAAGLTSLFVQSQSQIGCAPSDQASSSDTENAFTQIDSGDAVIILAGPSSKIDRSAAMPLFNAIFPNSDAVSTVVNNMQYVDTFDAFQQTILDHREIITTGFWLGDDSTAPTIAWVGNLFITSAMTAQQLLDVVLTNVTVSTTWSAFDVPYSPSTGDALNLVIYMGLALSCFPGFFALYPSNERRRFVRQLQYSNGVRPFPLWIAYLIFDFTIALVAAGVATALWAGLSSVWYHLEYVFVVFMLYGLASTILAYFVSLFTKSSLATFAWVAAGQVVIFLIYLIAYLSIITYAPVYEIQRDLLISHFVISAVAPIGSAIRALFLTTNLFSAACDNDQLSTNPSGITYFGGPILYLVLQALVLFALLLWFDSGSPGSSLRALFTRKHSSSSAEDVELYDEEVATELNRVTSSGTNEDGLQVKHVTKAFGTSTAVDNVTFGIRRGEVFALLGPNGAGKSTTISMIRGDLKPSRDGGDIFVEDVSVTKSLAAARSNLGVCPQIDALDLMTVREHLEFYAKVRGIPDIQHNVSAVLHAVGLEAFSNRMATALSGGSKRKLSLGISLMGNPTVVLLDEPSSGLDAASKRIMWKTLEATVPGRSILLTTHSMEEADALASRAGILARRMLALGTSEGLRRRFGDALHVHLICESAPRTSEEEMRRVVDWVRTVFPGAVLDEKTYHGQIRFSVEASQVLAASTGLPETTITQRPPSPSTSTGKEPTITQPNPSPTLLSQSAIGHLIIMLESQKSALGIGHYSVSPTGLDQVFLTIVGRHNVKEENYEEKGPGFWRRVWKFGRA